jgi:NTP pyrophosphatase (non-canonical NTP hydrolase)
VAEERPSLDELTERLVAFRDARDWRRFHGLKNLILSLNLEAGELLELTQWKSDAEVEAGAADPAYRAALAEECADVLLYLLLIAERAGIDLPAAAARKIAVNGAKYPVEKARGNARKYTQL